LSGYQRDERVAFCLVAGLLTCLEPRLLNPPHQIFGDLHSHQLLGLGFKFNLHLCYELNGHFFMGPAHFQLIFSVSSLAWSERGGFLQRRNEGKGVYAVELS